MAEVTREDVQGSEAKKDGEAAPKPFYEPTAPTEDKEPDGPPAAPAAPTEAPVAPEGAPSGEPPPSEPDLDAFEFPDHPSVPELLRGKKGSQAVKAYQTLFDTSKRMAAYMQQQAQTPPAPAAPPAPQEPLLTSDDFISGDPDVIEQKLGQLFERKAAPLLADIYKGMTIQTMHAAKANLPHYTKYEQEILQELAQTPINHTANFNTWKDAHDRVVARHIDEIAADRSRNRPPPPVTERGSTPPPQNTATELTPDDIKIADGLGVDHAVFARMKGVYASRTGEV